jgi:histidinol-phosphatase
VDEPALSDGAGPERDLEVAFALADAAARVTLPPFGARMPAELKSDRSPVTELDRVAERAVRDALATLRPDDGVIGEEGGSARGRSGRTWIIDPIDGTRLYAEGIPLWATLIALREGERVVLGVADVPALGERYHAAPGGGAWRGTDRLRVSSVDRLPDAFVAHSPLEGWLEAGTDAALERVIRTARSSRGLSDAWGQLLVARGSVDALLERDPCSEWDFAATALIVGEAGGRVSTFDGAPPHDGLGLVVTNGRLHDEVLAALGRGAVSVGEAAG